MALIGAAGKKSGKTELACSLIRRLGKRWPLVAVKVTPVDDILEERPPAGGGTLVSHRPKRGFFLWQEQNPHGVKDTSRLLRAGASRVFWLVVMADRTREGLDELLRIVGPGSPVICESNSLRLVAEPGIFLLVRNGDPDRHKRSVALVGKYADRIVKSNGKEFDLDLADVGLVDGKWTVKLPLTALLMADGTWSANRPGLNADRGCRKELVEAAAGRLRPWFKQLLIACSKRHRCPPTDIPVITVPGDTPAAVPRTVEAALRAAVHDRLLVTGCDPAQIDIDVIRGILRENAEHDAVLSPPGSSGAPPSIAVFRKDFLTRLGEMIEAGEEEIREHRAGGRAGQP
jgi:hypothetical protein